MKHQQQNRFYLSVTFAITLLQINITSAQVKLLGMRQRGGNNDVGTIYTVNADGSGFQKISILPPLLPEKILQHPSLKPPPENFSEQRKTEVHTMQAPYLNTILFQEITRC
jgi:hypothetical protein